MPLAAASSILSAAGDIARTIPLLVFSTITTAAGVYSLLLNFKF